MKYCILICNNLVYIKPKIKKYQMKVSDYSVHSYLYSITCSDSIVLLNSDVNIVVKMHYFEVVNFEFSQYLLKQKAPVRKWG